MNIYDPSDYWQLIFLTIYDLAKSKKINKTACTTTMLLKLTDIT